MDKQRSAQPETKGGLEIEDDPLFQQRAWRMERISWWVMAALILGALLGLFGNGFFSRARSSDASGTLQVEYEQLGRFSVPMRLHLHMLASQAGEVRFWLSRDYLDKMRVEAISPPPEHVETNADYQIYVFRVIQADTGLDVIFHLKPQRSGWWSGTAGTDAGVQVNFHSFIYP